jgi:hypothetical protein
MTVSAGTIKHVYNGNGTTRDWDYTFPIYTADGSDIKLYKTAIGGAITEITSNYSVDVVAKHVTYPTVASGLPLLATGEKITLLRTETLSQDADWKNQGPFNAETVESVADKNIMIAQQQNEALSRAVKYPVDQTPTSDTTDTFLTTIEAAKTAAQAAATAAQAAQTAAETAKTAAQAAQTAAETAKTGAQTAQTAAETAKTAAETAKTAAETAQAAAVTAKNAAETAQAAAASSASAAASSASAAATSATNAAASATAAANSASAAATSATNAANSATAAAASATEAANYAAALKATSTSSVAIGTGEKTFTTQASKQFAAGQFILIVDTANSANYMHGQVTSYSGTTLVVDVQNIGGSGTIASWNIYVSGSRGAIGATGPTGADEKVKNVSADASAGYLAEKLAALYPSLYQRDQKWVLKTPYTTAANRYTILTPAKLSVDINGTVYFLTAQAEVNLSLEASWDTIAGTDYRTAANRAGKDFYIYACVPVSGAAPKIVLSANSTTPSGYSGTTSRKIGGFHGLCVAVGTISGHTLTTFVAGDVLPVSIWDLVHRPVANPEGMVFSDSINKWVDIYLASGTGASTTSVYGGTISDTRDWNDFVDDGGAVKKRMLDDGEFQVIAAGSNEETNITGSADPGTTGGHVDTASRRMISNIGVEDACGVLLQWLSDQSSMQSTDAAGWYDLPGSKGQLYRPLNSNDVKLIAGGAWDNGVNCGSRGRFTAYSRWVAGSVVGCRFCAEPV